MGDLHNSLRHHGMIATSGSWRRHWLPQRGRHVPTVSTSLLRLLARWVGDTLALWADAGLALWGLLLGWPLRGAGGRPVGGEPSEAFPDGVRPRHQAASADSGAATKLR